MFPQAYCAHALLAIAAEPEVAVNRSHCIVEVNMHVDVWSQIILLLYVHNSEMSPSQISFVVVACFPLVEGRS